MTSSDIFEGITAVAQLGMATVVGIGVWVAHKQLEAWRMEARALRSSQIAEELLSLSYDVEDAFRHIRNPFDSIPVEDVDKPNINFQRRYDRVNSHIDLFQKLRDAQIRARAVIGNELVDKAVDVFFQTRNDILFAIDMLAHEFNEHDNSKEDRKEKLNYRRTMSGTHTDEAGTKISTALKVIVDELSPVARLDVQA